jgi:cbb3-type cytochrome oxidase maturation protein
MSVILILILASLAMALLFLGGFIWSVRSGQYDDTNTPSMRVLMDDPSPDEKNRNAGKLSAPRPAR